MKFEISDKEQEKINEWINSQRLKKTLSSTSGGRFSYIFNQTSIGYTVGVIDNLLNESLDVTDYDLW